MDGGYVLSNFPPIVENIFKYLTFRDLDTCAQVCDLWKRIAETEKNRRDDIFTFFQVVLNEEHKASQPDNVQECSTCPGEMENNLSKQLKAMKMKPEFCLAFASHSFMEDFETLFPSFQFQPSTSYKRMRQENHVQKKAYMRAVIQTALGQYLPEKCRTAFCVAPGITGCHKSGNDLLPLEVEDGFGITGVMIPFVPGVKIFHFPMDGKECDVSKLIPADLNVKCFLVFMAPYTHNYYDKIIQSCLMRQSSNVAIGGSFVNRSESGCGSCIAFCGEGVEAASVVIQTKDKESDVEAKLRLFQDTGLLKYRCFALMFSCIARGFYVYKKFNVESSIFNRLYPEVPVLGVFGNGEIGFDYLPNIPNNHQVLRLGKLVRCRKRYLHSYSSVFVLVSLKI